jgi:hypothetical protein
MKFRLLMAIAAGSLAGCASPWPDLPPRQYTGTVVNDATSLPVAGATLEATRGEFRGFALKMPFETIGHAKTDANGRFVLKTREGWASWMRAEAPGPYSGILGLDRKSSEDLTIRLKPEIQIVTSTLQRVEDDELKGPIGEMVERIVNYHDTNPSAPYLNLNQYLQRGVVTEAELAILDANPQLFTYPRRKEFTNKIFIGWGERLFVYRDRSTPIEFRHCPFDLFLPKPTAGQVHGA